MKKCICFVTFTLLMLCLLCLLSLTHAESTEIHMDQEYLCVKQGETAQFTYSVPDGYEVVSEDWQWFIQGWFTNEEESAIQQMVVSDGHGAFTVDGMAAMLRIDAVLNGTDTVTAMLYISSVEAAFTYEIENNKEPLINSAPIQIIAYLYAEVNLLAPDFYCLSKNIAILVHISGS